MSSKALPSVHQILSALSAHSAADFGPMLELLLSSIGDGVAITDVSGGVVYHNAAGRKILGIASNDGAPGILTHGSELYYLDDFNPIPESELPLVRALRGEDVEDVQIFVRGTGLPEGALVSLNAQPIREPSGRVVGGIAVFHDVGARKRAEEALQLANAKLGAWVAELERRAHIVVLMNDMADLLQSCRTMQEFYGVVARFSSRIFSGEPGAMFIVNASRSALEMVASWGGASPAERVFAADGCWALRRGRIHRAGGDALGPDCDHTSSEGTPGYTCIPMMGQGEALGILHVGESGAAIGHEPDLGATVAESRRRTVIGVAEHIALALANLRLRDTLRSQAIRDLLTGLFNRRYMEESLDRELTRASRSGGSVSALMIDVDHFKRFNDTHGHTAADQALRETANAIRASLRPDDIACRYGGEELVVILPDTRGARAAAVAETIRAAIERLEVRFQGIPLGTVTVSIGVAESGAETGNGEALLRAADGALYSAKRTGRNRVCVADRTAEAPASAPSLPTVPSRPSAPRTNGAGTSS